MRIFNINKGVVGSRTAIENGIRTRIDKDKEEQVKHRLKVLDHVKKFGMLSAVNAYEVSERTIKYWKARLKKAHGVLNGLASSSTRPHNTRKRDIPFRIMEYIKYQKIERPRLGKAKIAKLILNNLSYTISPTTVQNVVDELKKKKQLSDKIKVKFSVKTGKMIVKKPINKRLKQRIKDYKPENPGDLIQIDTIIIFINGRRYYILTAIDIYTRLAHAYISNSHTSANAEVFLKNLEKVLGYGIKRVQTDNGSEFHKNFDEACNRLHIIHYFNYPHSPKMNAYIERFNRTIQEEFLNMHKSLLMNEDLVRFNARLIDWLNYYNDERPHWGLHLNTPRCYTNQILGCNMYVG